MDVRYVKTSIIGLGLMGGSLGLSLSRAGISVTGWDESPDTVQEACRLGAIGNTPETLEEAVKEAEVIFVATPVETIPEVIKRCIPFTKPGTIFTDLGSIKEKILQEVAAFLPETHFYVAAHPMTGSEKSGVMASDPFLFQNAVYIVIEDSKAPKTVVAAVTELVRLTGAVVLTLTAAVHDRIIGMVSHLPHLLAVTLARTAGLEEEQNAGTLQLAAGGFRDTTRIAIGSPDLWQGILLGNKDYVLRSLTAFQNQLEVVKELIAAEDCQGLHEFLSYARETRWQIPAKNKGFLSLLHEMVVTIEDRPGTIDEVLRYLAREGLNIKDIEILRIREGDGGTLRLAFDDATAVDQALTVLREQGFKVRKR